MIDRRVFGSWRAQVVALALGVLPACGVEIPDGRFACGNDSECPSGWTCREPEGRCYRAPGGQDATLGDGGSGADAGHLVDASMPLDGGALDGGALDGGALDGGAPDGGAPDGGIIDAGPEEGGLPDGGRDGCVDGATQTIPCGLCGAQSQECADGHWGDVGACSATGACEPGTSEIEVQPCFGGCGTSGTRSRTRTCDGACGWGAWSALTACASCAPATETARETCGACGMSTRTRSCDTASCTWGAWGELDACSGEGLCAPGDSEVEPCGTPTTCGGTRGVRERFCSSSCAWDAWGACDCF